MKIQTILLSVLIAGFLFSGGTAYAAADDVTLETTTTLEVGGYDLTISGSSAVVEEIIVGATTFTVTLQNNSSITVASADRVDFAYDVEAETTTETCTDSESTLTLSVAAAGETTVVVTPSGTCTAEVEEEEEGSGGGGTSYRRDVEDTPSAGNDVAIEAIMKQIIELLQQLIAQLIAQQD